MRHAIHMQIISRNPYRIATLTQSSSSLRIYAWGLCITNPIFNRDT